MVTNEFKIFLECCILAQETSGSKIKFSFFSFSFGYSLRLVFILMKNGWEKRGISMRFSEERNFFMKAVVMAGGEGTRLRPLTCNIPKPMARLCGRPVLCYILDLLAQNGVDEVYLTLKYLPQEVTSYFNQGNYCGMQLHFVEEEIPLGTAGGVKNAARGFQEPFLVISGDALCDYQLREAVAFHNASGAQATLVTAQVEDPREYGLVRLEEDGRVEGFIEKPGWGQAVSDLANTGIYIVDPACLALVPEGRPFDFAKDLFPEMMRRGMPLYGYRAEGYWCDIGDLRAYLQCQRDLLAGKVKARFAPQIAQGIFAKGELPKGDFHLIPPVYIGENVEIAPGAQIGPDCVIDDHCFVGPGRKSTLFRFIRKRLSGRRCNAHRSYFVLRGVGQTRRLYV